jgi:hypothetical protein
MRDKIVWKVEDFLSNKLYCIFSTKGKAIEAIKMWKNSLNSYKIESNIDMIPRLDGKAATVNIRYDRDKRKASFYISKIILNNGAGIIHAYRHNGGTPNENKD